MKKIWLLMVVGFFTSCFADTWFFRDGKGLAGISQPDRKVTYYTYFVTDYDEVDEGFLREDVLIAALDVYDETVRPKLDNLKYEVCAFRVTGCKLVALIDLFWNDDIEFYKGTFSLVDEEAVTKDEIEITWDEYNEVCKKVNSGEKFDVIKLFKQMKKLKQKESK